MGQKVQLNILKIILTLALTYNLMVLIRSNGFQPQLKVC